MAKYERRGGKAYLIVRTFRDMGNVVWQVAITRYIFLDNHSSIEIRGQEIHLQSDKLEKA